MVGDSLALLSYQVLRRPRRPDARFKVMAAFATGLGLLVAHTAWQFVALTFLVAVSPWPPDSDQTLWNSVKPIFCSFWSAEPSLPSKPPAEAGRSIAHVSRASVQIAGRLSIQLLLLLAVTTKSPIRRPLSQSPRPPPLSASCAW